MNSYGAPHKGLRNALSQLSLLAGKTDHTSSAEIIKLYTLGKTVFLLLTTHAHDEDEVTLAELEKKMPGAAEADRADHDVIHEKQERLENLLEEIMNGKADQGEKFYILFNDFHALYLEHMAREEKETQQLLWDNFTDEELAGHRAMIMQKLAPPVLQLWLQFIIPALSHPERTGFLKGFRANAPEPFYLDTMSKLQSHVQADEWQKLQNALNS